MSEYTPITGELRDWFEHAYSYDVGETPWFGWKSTIEQMLDAIDAIHANLERENERLRDQDNWWLSPKDKDGEYIHIGDVMDFSKNVRNLTVLGIGMAGVNDSGWGVFVREGRDYVWYNAKFLRHHQPDTWERIIEDAIRGDGGSYGCLEERFNATVPPLVARCKALAGDAE